jgi:hypothetical protein
MPEIHNKHMHVQTKYVHVFHKKKEMPKILHHIHARHDPHLHLASKLLTKGGKSTNIVEIIEKNKHTWKPSPQVFHEHQEKPFQIVMDDEYKGDLNDLNKSSETQLTSNEFSSVRQSKFMPNYSFGRPFEHFQRQQYIGSSYPMAAAYHQPHQFGGTDTSMMYPEQVTSTGDEYNMGEEANSGMFGGHDNSGQHNHFMPQYANQYMGDMNYMPTATTTQYHQPQSMYGSDHDNIPDSMAMGSTMFNLGTGSGSEKLMAGSPMMTTDVGKFNGMDAFFKRGVKKYNTRPRNDKFFNKNRLFRNSNRRSQQVKVEGGRT